MSSKYLRISSDLHLEQYYGSNVEALSELVLPHNDRDKEAILVLAGDISSKGDQLVEFLSALENRFRHIVYVSGNHEWYYHDITSYSQELKEALAHLTKVSASINEVLCQQIDGIRFIFGTLWSDGGHSLEDQAKVGYYLNDFRVITLNGLPFRVSDMQQIHKRMKSDIEAYLLDKSSGLNNIVVTHHMPSYSLCHPRFGTEANGGFASECRSIMAADHAPTLWIHGHTHDTIDTKLFNTRIVCNPRGYHGEHPTAVYNQYMLEPKFIELSDV